MQRTARIATADGTFSFSGVPACRPLHGIGRQASKEFSAGGNPFATFRNYRSPGAKAENFSGNFQVTKRTNAPRGGKFSIPGKIRAKDPAGEFFGRLIVTGISSSRCRLERSGTNVAGSPLKNRPVRHRVYNLWRFPRKSCSSPRALTRRTRRF